MQGIDIRPLKMRLRGEIKAWRRALEPGWKAGADEKICARVLALREYAACSTLLTYVSLPIEVDTLRLISHAFADGKKVAAPRCVEGTHEMEFYEISSMDDLARQTFGVLEPVRERCRRLTDFSGSVCLVPALAYDRAGYRLGYGAGYYDRVPVGLSRPEDRAGLRAEPAQEPVEGPVRRAGRPDRHRGAPFCPAGGGGGTQKKEMTVSGKPETVIFVAPAPGGEVVTVCRCRVCLD